MIPVTYYDILSYNSTISMNYDTGSGDTNTIGALLKQVGTVMRFRHMSLRTERSYINIIRRFIALVLLKVASS